MDIYTAAFGISIEELRARLDQAEQKIIDLSHDASSIRMAAAIYVESMDILSFSGAGAKSDYCRSRMAAIRQLYADRVERFDTEFTGAEEKAGALTRGSEKFNSEQITRGALNAVEPEHKVAELDAKSVEEGLCHDGMATSAFLDWKFLPDKQLIRTFKVGDYQVEYGLHGTGYAFDIYMMEADGSHPDEFYRTMVDDIGLLDELARDLRFQIESLAGDWVDERLEALKVALGVCVIKNPELADKIFALPARFPRRDPTEEEVEEQIASLKKYLEVT